MYCVRRLVIVSLDNDEKEVRDYKVDEFDSNRAAERIIVFLRKKPSELRGLEEKNGASK